MFDALVAQNYHHIQFRELEFVCQN